MQVTSARFAGQGLLLAVVLLLCALTAPALAQDSLITEGDRFDPALSEEMSGTQADEPTSATPIDPADATTPEGEEDTVSDETIQQPGWGNAADQAPAAKRSEAATDCKGTPPPTSRMLGLPGSIGGSKGDSLGWLVLAIAAGALVVAAIAYRACGAGATCARLARHVATVVGILGADRGVAVQFVPGVGVAPDARGHGHSMKVRDINARIPQRRVRRARCESEWPQPEDRREVGNVVLARDPPGGLPRQASPSLQDGLYDPGAGDCAAPRHRRGGADPNRRRGRQRRNSCRSGSVIR